MITSLDIKNGVSLFLALVFTLLGIMNTILIHWVPGCFYLLISLLYYPFINRLLRSKLGFSIPYTIRFIIAFLLLWATLGVGDLAELYGL